jgi:hypothetical protein
LAPMIPTATPETISATVVLDIHPPGYATTSSRPIWLKLSSPQL